MEVEWEEGGGEESNVTESSQQDIDDSEIMRKKQVFEKNSSLYLIQTYFLGIIGEIYQ